MRNAFVVHAHHVYRHHPDLDSGVSNSCMFSSNSPILLCHIVRYIENQNLFLFDKLILQGFLYIAIIEKMFSRSGLRLDYQIPYNLLEFSFLDNN